MASPLTVAALLRKKNPLVPRVVYSSTDLPYFTKNVFSDNSHIKNRGARQGVEPQMVHSGSFCSSFSMGIKLKNMAGDNVLFWNWYLLGVKEKFKPYSQNRILVPPWASF